MKSRLAALLMIILMIVAMPVIVVILGFNIWLPTLIDFVRDVSEVEE